MAKLRRRLRVPGELQQLHTVTQFVKQVAREVGVSDDGLFQIELAVEEIYTNIIEHGYEHDGADKTVEVFCESDEQTLWIALGDEAPPFNPLQQQQADPATPLWERGSGGWGITFVRKYMDKIYYHYSDQRNWLVMEKRIG